MKKNEIIVYSYSGCSNVAQLANGIAVKLHRNAKARMSCIVGVGGDVKPLVQAVKNAGKIFVMDGCPLECAAKCLERHQIKPDVHIILTDYGLTKNPNEDVSVETFDRFDS